MLTKKDMDETREELARLQQEIEGGLPEICAHLGLDYEGVRQTTLEATAARVSDDPREEAAATFLAAVHFGMLLEKRRARQSGAELFGEIELAREYVDVAGFDQGHARAIESLRKANAFLLFTHLPLPEGYFGITYTHLVPAGDEWQELRAAFADTMERVAEEVRGA